MFNNFLLKFFYNSKNIIRNIKFHLNFYLLSMFFNHSNQYQYQKPKLMINYFTYHINFYLFYTIIKNLICKLKYNFLLSHP